MAKITVSELKPLENAFDYKDQIPLKFDKTHKVDDKHNTAIVSLDPFICPENMQGDVIPFVQGRLGYRKIILFTTSALS